MLNPLGIIYFGSHWTQPSKKGRRYTGCKRNPVQKCETSLRPSCPRVTGSVQSVVKHWKAIPEQVSTQAAKNFHLTLNYAIYHWATEGSTLTSLPHFLSVSLQIKERPYTITTWTKDRLSQSNHEKKKFPSYSAQLHILDAEVRSCKLCKVLVNVLIMAHKMAA